jgi:hypothetical protein
MSKQKAEFDPSLPLPGRSGHSKKAIFGTWDHPASNWNQAAMQSGQADPFCCRTEWQLSFHEVMAPHRELVVREVPGSVVALARLNNPQSGPVLVPVESGWLFGCPLLGPDAVELLGELIDEAGSWSSSGSNVPAVVLSGIEPGGSLHRQLVASLGSRFDFRRTRSNILCGATLEGGLDGFLARRSANHRRGLRKQARRAVASGVSFERHVPASEKDARAIYARMLAVEASSWKGVGHCGMTVQPSCDYYDRMLRRLAMSGSGRVMFARHQGRDIGFIFGALFGNVYRGQQFSYADDWKGASIGNLLQLEQIRWLCEEGAIRYDMGPQMGYKRHWTERRTLITTLALRPLKS